MRSGLKVEKLPPPPLSDPAPTRRSGLRAIFAAETLPEIPPAPPRSHASLFSVLFARESLPLDPERPQVHRNWLAFLFAPERLDPPGGSGPEVR